MIRQLSQVGTEEYCNLVRKTILGTVRRALVITFGCQQNEADSEKIRGLAEKMGYIVATSPEDADLIIVNTCAIREHAEMKALSMIGGFKALKRKNPELIIGVVGCMAAEPAVAEKLKQDFHYVSFTLEPNMLYKIPEMIYTYISENKRKFILGEDDGSLVEGLPAVRREKHRAWVSIMYGCNNFCSYCIVPYVRGRERSRASADVLEECRTLVAEGVKEITLLGQNVNSYRSDMDFPELISSIAEIEGDFIIRFMTSHPKDTSDKLISALSSHQGKIAPYFHLPLQSGSDTVLRNMNRTYTREKFLEIVEKLRAAVPGITLSTDVIVGFPGEEQKDFLDTLDVLTKARFDLVYAFIYSERKGTRAVGFDGKVPKEVKDERLSRLLALQDEISLAQSLPYSGTVQRVLVDSCELRDGKTVYTGRTPGNKPVHFTARAACIGEFINVKIDKCGAFIMYGSQI